jgi:hypothetical protein
MQAKYEELFAPKAELPPVEQLKRKRASGKTSARKTITKGKTLKTTGKKKTTTRPKK